MEKFFNRQFGTILTIALITFCFSAQLFFPSSAITTALKQEKLHARNEKYLNKSTEEALATFAIFSGIKGGLSIMESSKIGVDFIIDVDIAVGKLISAAKEQVDYGWRASIIALTALNLIRILVEFLYLFSSFFFNLALASLFIFCVLFLRMGVLAKRLEYILYNIFFVSFVACVGVPVVIYAASVISREITAPKKADVHQQLTERYGSLSQGHEDGQLHNQATFAVSNYTKHYHLLKDNHHHLTQQIVSHIVLVIFDIIVFPLGFLLGIFLILKWIVHMFRVRFLQVEHAPLYTETTSRFGFWQRESSRG